MPISTCTTFLIIVTWQFFYSNMKNYLCSQCPGWSLCWYKSEGLVPCDWARHHGGSLQCVCTVTDGRLFWFCLLWRLKTTFSLRGSLFDIFWTVSDIVFWQLVPFLKAMLVLQARLFHNSADHILNTNTGSDACCEQSHWLVRLGQQFVSIIKKRISPLRPRVNWWYKSH